MPASILLPPSTNVFVTAFTNAGYLQKVTITPPSGAGNPTVWQGRGENNHQIGSMFIMTPGGSQNFNYQVDAQNSPNGGQSWNESVLMPGGCVIATMNLKVLLSEDQADRDYNDAVVEFLWWEPF